MTEPYIVDQPEVGLFKVNRRVFTSAEVLRLEHERIFSRSWIYAVHESELKAAGDYVSRRVAGRPLVLIRGDDGQVRAFHNACSHRGAAVCREPAGQAHELRCPYHGWTFARDGRLIGVPGHDAYAPGFRKEDHPLRPVARFAGYRGFLFVGFDAALPSLDDYLAGAKEYLDLICDQSEVGLEVISGTHLYGARANWKLVVENNIDLYHVGTVHKRYFDYAVARGGDRKTLRRSGGGRALGQGHAAVESTPPATGRMVAYFGHPFPETMRPAIEARRARMEARFGAERARRMCEYNRNLVLFPNLIVNDAVSVVLRSSFPVSEHEVEITAWALSSVEDTAEERAARIHSFLTFLGPGGFGTPDDNEIIESCQRGYAGAEPGWSDVSKGMRSDAPMHDDELQIRAFWRRYDELMTGVVRDTPERQR